MASEIAHVSDITALQVLARRRRCRSARRRQRGAAAGEQREGGVCSRSSVCVAEYAALFAAEDSFSEADGSAGDGKSAAAAASVHFSSD